MGDRGMKPCQKHWEKLKAAIRSRGLWHLVAADGKAAMENVETDLRGRADDRNYDPLMACFFMITSRALDMGGLYLMTGDFCPVCEALKHRIGVPDENGSPCTEEGEESYWIDGPADAAMRHCQEIGLVPKVQ